jgi:hypothetical protein
LSKLKKNVFAIKRGHFFYVLCPKRSFYEPLPINKNRKGKLKMGKVWFGNAESLKKLKPIKITVTSNIPSPEALERGAKVIDTIAQNYVDQNLKHTA